MKGRFVTPRGSEWIRPTLTPSNNASLDPHESAPPNGISIGSAVFAYTAPVYHTERPPMLTTLATVDVPL